jgi:hypothetical protein
MPALCGEEIQVLNLFTGEGMRSVPLDQVQRIRFARSELDQAFRQALAVLAASHDRSKKRVVLHFSGQGERQVAVGYISECPLWKTAYRLVLAGTSQPFCKLGRCEKHV